MPKTRFLIGTILFTIVFISNFSLHVSGQISSQNRMATEILALINDHRAKMRKSPLIDNEYISQIALHHSRDMASENVAFGHDGFDDRVALLQKKIKRCYRWGENVAYGATTARQVVTMWLNSPEHRENIEGDYNLSGIGVAKSNDGQLYYTQIFIKAKK